MKKLPIAAAALLFGTSAFAMVPSNEPTGAWVDKEPWTVTGTTALSAAAADALQPQPAAADWWDADKPAVAADDAGAELKTADKMKADLASSDDFSAMDEEWEAAAAAKLAGEAESEAPPESRVEADAMETSVLDEEPVPVEVGVGGPYEPVETAAADLAPRPAAQNYPACRPGQGDDNCIQLYEPGVRQQLAAWNRPTGGFAGAGETQVADSATETERLNQQSLAESSAALQNAQMAAASADTQVAVGGPYEPVDEAALSETAMSGDGSVDTAMGEVSEDEAVEA